MLIFDFDGVLIDSVDEAAVTAYNTCCETLITSLSSLPPSYLNLFRANRCRGRSAGEMVVLANWCLEHKVEGDLLSNGQLEELVRIDGRSLQRLGEKFFEARNLLVASDRQAWLSLNSPYQPLWDWIRQEPESSLYILTYKNRQAVLDISEHFGVKLLTNNVYSGEQGATKLQNIRSFMHSVDQSKVCFVDDSIRNLLELKRDLSGQIELYLARWGYVALDDLELAGEHGISCINQQDLISLLSTEK